MRLIVKDGSEFIVKRPFYYTYRETTGFHHFKITKVITGPALLENKRVAIPLADIKYLILE
jgi:aspartate/methionine/tyrosine aminotransferase